MKCPICGATIDTEENKAREALGKLGYLHLDVWLKCPKCGYTPVFGVEKEPSKPPYFRPDTISKEHKQRILKAANYAKTSINICPFCGVGLSRKLMKVHKVFWNVKTKYFITDPELGGIIGTTTLPCYYLIQLKCPKCFYVRYFTI